MKKLILSLSTVFCLCVLLSSCGKDVCYDCAAYDDGSGFSIDAATYCEGDSLTKTQVDAAVLLHEGFGGTCTKQ